MDISVFRLFPVRRAEAGPVREQGWGTGRAGALGPAFRAQ